jgi:hypothetical protein
MTKETIKLLLDNMEPTRNKINNTIDFYEIPQTQRDVFELMYLESIAHLSLDEILMAYTNEQISWASVRAALESIEDYETCAKVAKIQSEETREFINILDTQFQIRKPQGKILAKQINDKINEQI